MAIVVAGANRLTTESVLGAIASSLRMTVACVDDLHDRTIDRARVSLVLIEYVADAAKALAEVRMAFPSPVKVAVYAAPDDGETAMTWLQMGFDGYMPRTMSGVTLAHAANLILRGERFVPSVVVEPPPRSAKLPSGAEILSRREGEILLQVATGASNKAIARALRIEEVTVKTHLKSVFRKLGVQSRVEAARFVLSGEAG